MNSDNRFNEQINSNFDKTKKKAWDHANNKTQLI